MSKEAIKRLWARRAEDITGALWGTRLSPSAVSNLDTKIYTKIEARRNRRIDTGVPQRCLPLAATISAAHLPAIAHRTFLLDALHDDVMLITASDRENLYGNLHPGQAISTTLSSRIRRRRFSSV
jgi:hypothetical protein